MASHPPSCVTCRATVHAGQDVVFRSDGRVEHVICPEVVCPVCDEVVKPGEPIRREGPALLHGNCWAKRNSARPRSAESAPVEDGLTTVIRGKLSTGELPAIEAHKVWAGLGKDVACSGCGQIIARTDVQHDVCLPSEMELHFHRNCFAVWQRVVGKPTREIRGGSAPSPWTLFFDLGIARRAVYDRAAHAERRAATAETLLWSCALRERSRRLRASRTTTVEAVEQVERLAHRAPPAPG